ncbi:hypothetical protein F511_37038 [Dorcoceras hygrometricum]|uniref:Uncharacterized protein n=1 Tax=Dorcoceras hygrometricum TaxID=472368 RepID=A0A2Z7D3I3_9LAMI|nr:hypothetical protein F511_37038 [Dorcoceras hygrometricum]
MSPPPPPPSLAATDKVGIHSGHLGVEIPFAPGSDQFYEEIGTSTVGGFVLIIRSTTGIRIPSSVCTRKLDEDFMDGISSPERSERDFRRRRRAAEASAAGGDGGGGGGEERKEKYKLKSFWDTAIRGLTTFVTPKPHFRTNPLDHDSIGYPRTMASGESSTTKHRILHASGPHPTMPPDDPN